jgi:hypothetical protein
MLLPLTLITSFGTIVMMQALAHKKRWGWLASMVNQVLWLAVIYMTQAWGLLFLNAVMWYTAIQGWRNWNKSGGA